MKLDLTTINIFRVLNNLAFWEHLENGSLNIFFNELSGFNVTLNVYPAICYTW